MLGTHGNGLFRFKFKKTIIVDLEYILQVTFFSSTWIDYNLLFND